MNTQNNIFRGILGFSVVFACIYVRAAIAVEITLPPSFSQGETLTSDRLNSHFKSVEDSVAGAADSHSLDSADGSVTDALYITNNGMIGIGTLLPNTAIHIVEQTIENGFDAAYGNPWLFGKHIEYGASQAWALKSMYGNLFTWDSDSLFVGLKDEGVNRKDVVIAWGDDPQDNLRFIFMSPCDPCNDPATQTKEVMRIMPSGNVGIGTTTPQGALDVNGAIYQRGGVLSADYVYEDNYSLETIQEHTKFMFKNKHLKGIPKSKKDINGLEVVEVGVHRRGIVEELEKAHIYISQLEEKVTKLERLSKSQSLEARIVRLESLIK